MCDVRRTGTGLVLCRPKHGIKMMSGNFCIHTVRSVIFQTNNFSQKSGMAEGAIMDRFRKCHPEISLYEGVFFLRHRQASTETGRQIRVPPDKRLCTHADVETDEHVTDIHSVQFITFQRTLRERQDWLHKVQFDVQCCVRTSDARRSCTVNYSRGCRCWPSSP